MRVDTKSGENSGGPTICTPSDFKATLDFVASRPELPLAMIAPPKSRKDSSFAARFASTEIESGKTISL